MNQFGIPGTDYRIQLEIINGKWVYRLLKGNILIESYAFKEEDLDASGFPNHNLIVGVVLRTIASPNINPHQILKTIQALTKQLIEEQHQALTKQLIEEQHQNDDDDDRFPHPYIFKPPKLLKTIQALTKQLIEEQRSLTKQLIEEQHQNDDDDDRFPHPYIFKPPKPPGDLAMMPQVQVRSSLKEKGPEYETNCQFCGRKLTKEEQHTHSCKKKPYKPIK